MMYVYKFLDMKSRVLYVGKTSNIKDRMNAHFSSGHLPLDCYRAVHRIEYVKLRGDYSATVREIYYIHKYTPKFNTLILPRTSRYPMKKIPWVEYKGSISNRKLNNHKYSSMGVPLDYRDSILDNIKNREVE